MLARANPIALGVPAAELGLDGRWGSSGGTKTLPVALDTASAHLSVEAREVDILLVDVQRAQRVIVLHLGAGSAKGNQIPHCCAYSRWKKQ